MRNYIKLFSIFLFAGLAFTACETTDLDLQISPNDLAADQADPNLLLNSIQLAYGSNQQILHDNADNLTRIGYFNNRDYFAGLPGNTLNGVWSRVYSSGTNLAGEITSTVGILTNLQAIESINAESETDYSFHEGVAKTLYAHSLFQLVDFLGGAAFSQAGNATDFPAPVLDSGADVYAGALALLDEAEALLAADPDPVGATDLFYDEDTAKWVKLINTLKLRTYFLTGNTAAFDAVIAGDNFISDTEDDFQFQYGTSALQPDNRHPDYIDGYTPSGNNEEYRSNWLMNQMLVNDDPRRFYYFYRQQDATPGADADPNEETLVCSFVVPPPHYDGFIYCSVPEGYWGRSHGNDEGGPPDNFLTAAPGVYPAAGKFDDSAFGVVGLGVGGGGAGIEPLMLASYVDFWRGAMATSDTEKAAFLRAGMEKSIAKVQSFGSLDGGADLSTEPDEDAVTDFIDGVIDSYNAATGDDKENIFAEQFWVTLYGGATESYNYYRKTGFPTTLAPNWEPDPGSFPRTFLLPENEVINNPSLTQRTDLSTQVFWDTNPAGPAFPAAN